MLGRSACFREAETARLSGSRSRTVVFRLPFQRPQSRTKLAVFHVSSTSRLPQAIRLASGQDLRHDVSRQTRGQLSTRSLDHKTLSFQCLAALPRWRLLFRRHDQTALESGFRQGRQGSVIHFSPDQLWTAVDNSTVHRIGHPHAGTGRVFAGLARFSPEIHTSRKFRGTLFSLRSGLGRGGDSAYPSRFH